MLSSLALNVRSSRVGPSVQKRFLQQYHWDILWEEFPALHLNAYKRTITGKNGSKFLRSKKHLIPGLVFHRTNLKERHLVSFDRIALDNMVENPWFKNSIITLNLTDPEDELAAPRTLKVLPNTTSILQSKQKPINISMTLWEPGQRLDLDIPLYIGGEESSNAIANGAYVELNRRTFPCVWKGDEGIPKFIYIDISALPVGARLRTHQIEAMIPEGLVLKEGLDPNTTIVRIRGKGEHLFEENEKR